VKRQKEVGKNLMTNLKEEVGENDKFTHFQNMFSHIQQKWYKSTRMFKTSTNSHITRPVFTHPRGGIFGDGIHIFLSLTRAVSLD